LPCEYVETTSQTDDRSLTKRLTARISRLGVGITGKKSRNGPLSMHVTRSKNGDNA